MWYNGKNYFLPRSTLSPTAIKSDTVRMGLKEFLKGTEQSGNALCFAVLFGEIKSSSDDSLSLFRSPQVRHIYITTLFLALLILRRRHGVLGTIGPPVQGNDKSNESEDSGSAITDGSGGACPAGRTSELWSTLCSV